MFKVKRFFFFIGAIGSLLIIGFMFLPYYITRDDVALSGYRLIQSGVSLVHSSAKGYMKTISYLMITLCVCVAVILITCIRRLIQSKKDMEISALRKIGLNLLFIVPFLIIIFIQDAGNKISVIYYGSSGHTRSFFKLAIGFNLISVIAVVLLITGIVMFVSILKSFIKGKKAAVNKTIAVQ